MLPSTSDTLSGQPPSDYEEVLYWRITQSAGRLIVMNLLSIPLFVVMGIGFLVFVILFGQPPEVGSGDLTEALVLLLSIFLVIVLHELAHGLAMRAFGARPKYGVIWKGLMFYATAPGYAFKRNQYMVVTLAPLVSLSILACSGILLLAGTSVVWLLAICAATNGAAAIGDLWIMTIVLRYPAQAYIVDERDGMRVFMPHSQGQMK